MTETNKLYTLVDVYGDLVEDLTFDDYESAEEDAKRQAKENPGLEIFVIECKRVAKVLVPEFPDPIVTKL
jgi:hypothetical protein